MKRKFHKPINHLYIYIYIYIICQSVSLNAQNVDCTHDVQMNQSPPTTNCHLDVADKASLPIITIYINVYFVGPQGENFTPDGSNGTPNGVTWVDTMINAVNSIMSNLQDMNYAGYPSLVGDTRIRFALYTEANNQKDQYGGIFFSDTTPIIIYPNKALDVTFQDVFPTQIGKDTTINGEQSGREISMYNLYYFWKNKSKVYNGWYSNRLFLHELGHYLGLCHSFSYNNICDGVDLNIPWECNGTPGSDVGCGAGQTGCKLWDAATHNIMSYSSKNRDVFSPCQWKIAYSNAVHNRGWFNDCQVSGSPIVIQSGTNIDWTYSKIITNNVVVSPNSTLKIDCLVEFTSEAGVEVQRGGKLIIGPSGVLTNFCKEYRWKGIQVWGNTSLEQPDPESLSLNPNGAGVVICQGGSQIINANTGISTQANLPWPQKSAYYGGVIKAEGADFINCKKGVEFLKYDFANKSSFTGCEFYATPDFVTVEGSSNKTGGVTIWDCEGINFEHNIFKDLADFGILGIDFSCDVKNGNIFNNVNVGINAKSTYEYSSQINVIGAADITLKNLFENNRIHIVASNADYNKGIIIDQNIFKNGSEVGILIINFTKFNLTRNIFINHKTGISISKTGLFTNSVACNVIDEGCVGIYAEGNNENFTFLDNNFSNYTYDFNLEFGKIAEYQGYPTNPAENCFSNISILPGSTDDNMRVPKPSSSFKYYTDQNLPISNCQYPKGNGINYFFKIPTFSLFSGCNLNYTNIENLPPPPFNLSTFVLYKNLANNAYQALIASPTDSILDLQYHIIDRQKQLIFESILYDASNGHNNSLVHQILNAEGSKQSVHKRFGQYMRQNEYANAINILNTLPDSLEDDYDYKYMQRVNLARLVPNAFKYQPTLGIIDTLQNIITKNSINSGMATAISYLLGHEVETNNFLAIPMCQGGGDQINNREREKLNLDLQDLVKIYPNPVNNVLIIEFVNNKVDFTKAELTTLYGQTLKTDKIYDNKEFNINTAGIPNGTYFLILSSESSGQKANYKIVVNH